MHTQSLDCIVAKLARVKIVNQVAINANENGVARSAGSHICIGQHDNGQFINALGFFLFRNLISDRAQIPADTRNHILSCVFREFTVRIRGEEICVGYWFHRVSQFLYALTPILFIRDAHASTSFRRPLRLYTVFGV